MGQLANAAIALSAKRIVNVVLHHKHACAINQRALHHGMFCG
jgi:hypothetical protein